MPYLGLGAEISLAGYVLKTPPVGILDVPKKKKRKVEGHMRRKAGSFTAFSSPRSIG